MKRLAGCVAYWIVMGLFLPGGFAEQKPPDSLPDGGKMPVPPRQSAAWAPPAGTLPKPLVSAATKLFQQGLADPRGCEYREIELFARVENHGSDCDLLITRGWVLPRSARGQRFAVGWNGLVCPVTKVGPRADLRKDVLAVLAADAAFRAEQGGDGPESTFRRDSDNKIQDDREALSIESMGPLKACLLLRLGEGDLAARFWAAWKIGTEFADPEHADPDPYPMLAKEWTDALLDQALSAHVRYDDNLALASAGMLAAVRPAVEAESSRRGQQIELPRVAAVLLADQQRRLALRKAGKAPPSWTHGQSDYWDPQQALRRDLARHLEQLPDDAKVVAEVIRLLEECNDAHLDDPFMDVLVAEGKDAVEPLLDCLVNDRRLTRSVCGQSVTSVAEMATRILARILQTGFCASNEIDADDPIAAKARKALAAEIRSYWKKFKDVPLVERWYRTLGDDAASADDWLAAAGNITLPGDRGTEYIPRISRTRPKPGQRRVLHGDALRGKRHPSVSELMIRRVEALAARKERPDDRRETPLNKACEMAMHLADWDLNAAMPVLQRQTQRCRDAIAAHGPAKFVEEKGWATYAARFAITRAAAGDRQALDEYAAWIRGTTPQTFQREAMAVLEPLWRFPREKATRKLADWLFTNPASPWNPLGRMEPMFGYVADEIVKSRLVALPAFRRLLLKLLADKTVIGNARVGINGQIDIAENGKFRWSWGCSGYGAWDSSDPRCPPKGTVMPIRTCEIVAADLGYLDGMPAIRLYWPEAERDRAVAVCADILKRYGSCYVASDSSPSVLDRPVLVLPLLNHPATAEDVQEGRAIFSLAGQGQVRTVRFAHLPQRARWTASREDPSYFREEDPKTGKSILRIAYEQRGEVWQAEEIHSGGHWQRYFGFVGARGMHKVPAADIEFETPFCWKRFKESLDMGIVWPGTFVEGEYHTEYVPIAVGDALPVRLMVENGKGTDCVMPWFFDAAGAKPAGGGIAVRTQLFYTPDDFTPGPIITKEILETASKIAWTTLKPKRAEPLPFDATAKNLGPAEQADVIAFDTARWFPVEKPGTYRLRFEFNAAGTRFEPIEGFMEVLRK